MAKGVLVRVTRLLGPGTVAPQEFTPRTQHDRLSESSRHSPAPQRLWLLPGEQRK